MMSGIPTWVVELSVYGPVTLKRSLTLNEPKGFRLEDPFYSNIELRNTSFGIRASVMALASKSQLANKAALFFFGQMLDALAIQISCPLYLSFTEQRPDRRERHAVRRVVEREEWQLAFHEARLLALSEPTFLRALGWYRKGLYTEDPFDRFFAFWLSMEIVAGKYHPRTERTEKGIRNQMWECFKTLWGECDQWPIIKGEEKWIDDSYQTRVDIAHGAVPVNVESVEAILPRLDTIQMLAHAFLHSWRDHQLDPRIPPESERLFGYDY